MTKQNNLSKGFVECIGLPWKHEHIC